MIITHGAPTLLARSWYLRSPIKLNSVNTIVAINIWQKNIYMENNKVDSEDEK